MQRHNGFTLIELLVVIAIMTTVLSLVAPLMIEQIDKTKAAAEYRELEQYLSDSAKVAFLKGQPIRFHFNGKQLRRIMAEETVKLDFRYLFFPPQQLSINANGFISQSHLNIVSGNKSQQINLAPKQ
jgi:prepilin-type N-terminal cleavage/methylation domain-containing protein